MVMSEEELQVTLFEPMEIKAGPGRPVRVHSLNNVSSQIRTVVIPKDLGSVRG
jgi:hypothetical protein